MRGAAWSAVPDGKSAIAAFDWIQTGLKKLRTPALALTLCAALAMTVPDAAHAARSGGRVGGSSFRRCESMAPVFVAFSASEAPDSSHRCLSKVVCLQHNCHILTGVLSGIRLQQRQLVFVLSWQLVVDR